MAEKMRAARIHQYGRRDVVTIENIETPTPGPHEVLVKVVAASVNPRDWLLMRGIYQAKRYVEPLPATLGSDFSGVITEIGSEVTRFQIGDAVFGMQPLKGQFGAFAEYVKIVETAVALKPGAVSHSDAAAIPCAGLTSFQALHDIARLSAGQKILINGASGGVGTYAVQIAHAAGAHVVAVCGPDNGDLCISLGANEVINYREENFEDRHNEFDVVYDVIGRSSPAKSARALRKGGKYITTIPGFKTAAAAMRSWLAAKLLPGARKTAHLILVKPVSQDLTSLAQMIESGTLKSVIDRNYPLAEIQDALEYSQSWRTRGKIIIAVGTGA